MKRTLIFPCIVLSLTACDPAKHKDKRGVDERIPRAEKCLSDVDTSTLGSASARSAVDECLKPLSSLDSPQALRVKCRGSLLKFGQTQDSLQAAMTTRLSLEADPLTVHTAMAAYLHEIGIGKDLTDANAVYETCSQTNLPDYHYAAGMIQIATTMSVTGTNSAANMADDCLADTTNCSNADMGKVLLATETRFCFNANTSDLFCQTMNSNEIQRAASNDASVASEFLKKIDF